MFKLVVVVQTLPEKAEAFEEMVRPLIENSRREKGNISYDVLPDVLHQNTYLILETWENDKALEEHKATRHYLDFAESVNGYIAAPLVLYRVDRRKLVFSNFNCLGKNIRSAYILLQKRIFFIYATN